MKFITGLMRHPVHMIMQRLLSLCRQDINFVNSQGLRRPLEKKIGFCLLQVLQSEQRCSCRISISQSVKEVEIPGAHFAFLISNIEQVNECLPHLPLQDIDLPVFDVHLVPELAELVRNPVLVLCGGQRGLSLLLDHLVLLLQLSSQLIDLKS